jgi:hypothetical protein
MTDGPDDVEPNPTLTNDSDENEEYGTTPEERLKKRQLLLWALAMAVPVGAGLWVASQVVSLLFQRPGVDQTKGVAQVLQWTRIIDQAAYGVMVGALAIMGALLLLDALQRRFAGRAAFVTLSSPIDASDHESAPLEEQDEEDDQVGVELTEADLTDEEFTRLLRAEAASRRDFRPAILLGARIALFVLAFSVVMWTATSAAAAFFFPFIDQSRNPDTYVVLQHIALAALYLGLGMLALIGGGVLVHELGRRLSVTD